MKQRPSSTVQIGQFFKLVLPALLILIVGTIAILGILVYRISHSGAVSESIDPSHSLLPSLDVSMPAGKGDEIPAWWIPGLKGAPGIVLAPGYGMSRSDA